ncbi:MAG TPA: hypothetical protein VJR06_00980, partial [Nitrososphaerales archaeon]|nr:hypothetical protein [Nitrososphaerales archaeon]
TTSYPTAHPQGKRFVILPTLSPPVGGSSGPSWDPTPYTPQDVLNILTDLQPDTLHRYIARTAAQDPNAIVPGSDPAMTVTEFVQASMDASGSVVIPKTTFEDYDSDPQSFFQQTMSLLDLPVNPSFEFLSIDNWETFTGAHGAESVQLLASIVDNLRSQGWKGIEAGACGAPGIPSGLTDFSLFCVDGTTWEPEYGILSEVEQIPSNKAFQLSIDYPQPIQAFAALPPDRQEQLVTGYASAQGSKGFNFIYPIIMYNSGTFTLNYDSTKQVTSSGKSMYDVMKSLMAKYN